jgi:hypothetical protein
MTDTSPEIAELVRARLMTLSGAERFLMGIQMCDAARRMVLASLPADLPDAVRKQLLYERYHGEPLPPGAGIQLPKQSQPRGTA